MDLNSGTILRIIDNSHILVELDTGEKIWVGSCSIFSNLSVGKKINLEIIQRYSAKSFFQNNNGKYKLIQISNSFETSKLLYYKNEITGKIINVTLSNSVNSVNRYVIGEKYDLELIPLYKGINIVPDLPSNKTSINEKITIINVLISNNNTYEILNSKNEVFIMHPEEKQTNIVDNFLGKSLLATIYPKYLASRIYPLDILNTGITLPFIYKGIVNDNPLLTNSNQDYLLYNKVSNDLVINKVNLGVQLTINFNYVGVSLSSTFQKSNDGIFQLLSVINWNDSFNIYLFKNKNDKNVIALRLFKDINLNNDEIGNYFKLNYQQFFLLKTLKAVNDNVDVNTHYLLETIIEKDGICIFSINNKIVVTYNKLFSISPSKTGKYFIIDYSPFIYGFVNDVNDVNV